MSNSFSPAPPAYEPYASLEAFLVRPRRRRYWIPAILLLATFFSTTLVGSRLEFNFQHNLPAFSVQEDTLPLFPLQWIAHDPQRILLGLPFSITLLLILLAHEMGHYLMALRYRVDVTLPFFIPAPTLIGTLGAFIRIKSPVGSRRALFDIGIAGPLAGFMVAFPVLILALALSKPVLAGAGESDVVLGFPLIFHLVHGLLAALGFGAGRIPLGHVYLHPIAVAAWVGMFATSLNLLPGGQLDGGHIVFSVAPRAHRHLGNMTVAALFTLGIIGMMRGAGALSDNWNGWPGWILWGGIVLLMGRRHPPVPEWPGLDHGRQILAVVALVLLILTFIPVPLYVP